MNTKDSCKGIGTRECEIFRERIFNRHRWLSHAMASEYLRINRKCGYPKANIFLLDIEQAMKLGGTGLWADNSDSEFVAYASAKSKQSEADIMELGRRCGSKAAIAAAQHICQVAGLEYPIDIKPKDNQKTINKKHVAAMARVCCDKWWRRKIRDWAARQVEQVCRLLGIVNRKKGKLYVSDFTLARRREQKKRNNQVLKNLIAENEEGYSLSLAEASAAGMANPVNRRNELMVRIRGFEQVANSIGCMGVFITLTAPGQFHAVHDAGFKNSKFNGSTPSEVQEYLNGIWAKVRSAWHKAGIRVFGFRIVEPHHDGTPHWHQLLFIRKEQRNQAMDIFLDYATEMDKEELATGTDKRFMAIDIDPTKGSAVGYIAKYISKNIDGENMGSDFESQHKMTPAEETAARVEAWASTWGIRQFQQIGSASVTVWREVRRAEKQIREGLAKNGELDAACFFAELSEACEAQDWAKFVELMGGAFIGRNEQTVRPLMAVADDENKYGEKFKKIQGVIMRAAHRLITRIHTWTIKKVSVEANSVFKARGWGRDFIGAPWVCWLEPERRISPRLGLV